MTDIKTQNDIQTGENSKGQSALEVSLSNPNTLENKATILSFIIKKGTQISTAIYYVTDHIDVQDPMRQELRKAVLALSISLSKSTISERTNTPFHEISVNLEVVTNLLHIASGSAVISTTNAEILFIEINKIKSSVATLSVKTFGPYTTESDTASLGLGRLFGDEITDTAKSSIEEKTNTSLSTVSDKPVVRNEQRIKTSDTSQKDLAMRHIRRESIIRLLKQRKIVGLNDIKDVIPNLSDKTLQRELMSLIAEGVIVRRGEKRWARYSLA